MVVVRGLMTPQAGHTLQAALDPLARPADHHDHRSGGQRTADALEELARRQLESGRLPITGGVRPQLSVIVDLHSLDGRDRLDRRDGLEGVAGQPARIDGEGGRLGGRWAGPGRWNLRPADGWPVTPPSPA
jgi:hypothetical protein